MNKVVQSVVRWLAGLNLKRDQLFYDLTMLLSIITYQLLTSYSGKTVTSMFSTPMTLFLCMFFLLMLSISCGYLHMRYSGSKRFFGYCIIGVVVMLLGFPLTVMSALVDVGNVGIVATFVAGTGFALGRLIASDNMALTLERYTMLLTLVPISVGLIFWMIGYTGEEGYKGVLICVLGFAGVALLGFAIHHLFKKLGSRINAVSKSVTFSRSLKILLYVFWGLTAFAVCTWQEVLSDVPGNTGSHRLFILSLSGIIPYRILWAFAPPRNRATTVVATFVVAVSLLIVYLG